MSPPSAETNRQREAATDVVRRLRRAGHEAWFVGGCVREMLLGHEPKDFDVTTDADPDRVVEIFDHVVEVGRRFGVMTVVEDGVHVEVATFRTEGSYSDGRRPDEIAFATAEEDVSRRDFTLNAILYDPIEDRIVDHVGGREDLAAGLIRTVGDPEQRFREDHLRLLRAVRFAARFGFRLEPATEAALRALAPLVAIVSPERIHAELERMLVHANRCRAAELLLELGLLAAVLPELAAVTPELGGERADVSLMARLQSLPEAVSTRVAWATLLSGLGSADELDEILVRLRFANAERKAIERLVHRRTEPFDHEKRSFAARRRFLADPSREELLLVALAEARASGRETGFVAALSLDLERHGSRLPDPLVTGGDLRATSLPVGPAYAVVLERLMDEQLEGRLSTREQALNRLAELAAEWTPR